MGAHHQRWSGVIATADGYAVSCAHHGTAPGERVFVHLSDGRSVPVRMHGSHDCRNTIDLDIVIRPADSEAVSELLSRNGFQWDPLKAEFRTEDGIAVRFCIAGEPAGKGSEVRIPEPVGEQNVEEREGLRVVRLSRLIEMKIACGTGNLRRTHKDLADVVELIAIRKLDSSFARFLDPTLRPYFRTLVNNARASDG